jgi:hypothetical protein
VANYTAIYNAVWSYVNDIQISKSNGDSDIDFRTNYLSNLIKHEVLESTLFNTLFTVVWNNCEDLEQCKKALNDHMAQYQSQFNQSKVLKQVIVAYQLLTDISKCESVLLGLPYKHSFICLF